MSERRKRSIPGCPTVCRTDGPATWGQQRVLDAVRALTVRLKRAPSFSEIQRRLRMRSIGTVAEHVAVLKAKGLLRTTGLYGQGVTLTGQCPVCGGASTRGERMSEGELAKLLCESAPGFEECGHKRGEFAGACLYHSEYARNLLPRLRVWVPGLSQASER